MRKSPSHTLSVRVPSVLAGEREVEGEAGPSATEAARRRPADTLTVTAYGTAMRGGQLPGLRWKDEQRLDGRRYADAGWAGHRALHARRPGALSGCSDEGETRGCSH